MCATSRSATPRRSRRPPRCWRARAADGKPYVSLLGSRRHTFFTDGGRELFDCAGQPRVFGKCALVERIVIGSGSGQAPRGSTATVST